jgi:hypothetical protein
MAITAGWLLLWNAEVAEACSVCFSGRGEQSREAFRDTTIFLSFLPFLAIAGVAWWLRRRVRQLENVVPGSITAPAD